VKSTTSWAPYVRTRDKEKLIQLLEGLTKSTRNSGGDCTVESFFRGIEIVHGEQSFSTSFFEDYGGEVEGRPSARQMVRGPVLPRAEHPPDAIDRQDILFSQRDNAAYEHH
jgi:hypothetical protein